MVNKLNLTTTTTTTSAFKKFTLQLIKNERYTDWFPLREQVNHNLRTKNPYKELHAKTKRLYDSPLFTMRRLLNQEIGENEEDEA